MLSFTCSCGKPYTFKEKFLGQKFRCSQCGAELIVEEQAAVPSIPEPELPTELALNPEKAASLKAPPPQAALQEPAPLTPDYGAVAAPPKPSSFSPAPVEGDYVLISNSAPEYLKEAAMQTPEEAAPPSEALSVILGRAAVAEHLKHLEDTLGIRPTPVPVPVNLPKRRKKDVSQEPEQKSEAAPTPPEPKVMQHVAEKNPNMLIITLLIIIGVLVLGILALLVFKS